MYFIVLAADRPGALQQRLEHRQEHLDYWNGKPGTVKVAGAMLTDAEIGGDPRGSAFVIEAGSMEEARALIAGDPFSIRRIFGDDLRIEVLRPAIGDWFPR